MDLEVFNSLGWVLTAIIGGVGIVLAIFLVLRQIVLWYFRINEIAEDLHVIAQHYRALDYNSKRQTAPQTNAAPTRLAPMVAMGATVPKRPSA